MFTSAFNCEQKKNKPNHEFWKEVYLAFSWLPLIFFDWMKELFLEMHYCFICFSDTAQTKTFIFMLGIGFLYIQRRSLLFVCPWIRAASWSDAPQKHPRRGNRGPHSYVVCPSHISQLFNLGDAAFPDRHCTLIRWK